MTGSRSTSYPWRTLLVVAICSTLGGVLVGVSIAPQGDRSSYGVTAASSDPVRPPHRKERAVPRPDRSPVGLRIAAIDVTTPLVRLGLMPDRTVEVPNNPDRAGWFHLGPTPGRRGSAVILGHVDSVQGPAVFARLQELQPGDVVAVDREDGSTIRFVVRKAVLYANADFPAHRVYAATHRGRRLNLVTCGGSYDSTRGGYQSNLVVYTQRMRTRDS